MVDGPGGELDRVGGVGFGLICLAGGKLGIALVGPPVSLASKSSSLAAASAFIWAHLLRALSVAAWASWRASLACWST